MRWTQSSSGDEKKEINKHMNFTDFLDNKDEFVRMVKDQMQQRAFSELEELKKEMSNDFMKEQEQD